MVLLTGDLIFADLTYRRYTAPDGEIGAVFIPSSGFTGRLFADATVTAGGS